jgi:hypothetical protein
MGAYQQKKGRLPPEIVNRIVPISWNNYVEKVIEDTSISSEHVWIVGKRLHDLLLGKHVRSSSWIY